MRKPRETKPRPLSKEAKKEASNALKAEVDGFLAQIDDLLKDQKKGRG